MATVNGTTSRRASNYDFYFTYSVEDDSANKEFTITVKAYLKCISWDFETSVSNDWVHINIGGTTYNKPSAGLNCNQYSLPHTYLLWTKSRAYAYSSNARSVYLRAYTDDLYVAGHGPGVCNATTTITLPAKYSTAGSLVSTANSECKITMKISGLPSKVGFTRTLKWYYKKSSGSAYTLAYTTTISGSSTSTSFSKTVDGLLPTTAYSTIVKIFNGDDLIVTKSDAVTTNDFEGTFAVKAVGAISCMLMLRSVNSFVPYTRILKLYYKKSSETKYALAATNTLAIGDLYSVFKVLRLSPHTAYDFKLKVYAGDVLISTKTILNGETNSTDIFPVASMYNAVNVLGTTKIRVYWGCLTYPTGSYFKVGYQKSGGALVESTSISTPPTAYTEIDVGSITEDTDFTITVKAYVTGESGYTTSDAIVVTVYKGFVWDSAKTQGATCIITANEWNRLLGFATQKNPTYFTNAMITDIAATAGTPLDNTVFNLMQTGLGITDNAKDDADPVTAAELNALVTALEGE